jgi:small neutral amino acid transporter SnatA (MarC family)
MPRIKTTRTVRFALWALRIYLLILLLLIGIKFVRVFSSSQKQDKAATSTPAAAPVTTNPATVGTKP